MQSIKWSRLRKENALPAAWGRNRERKRVNHAERQSCRKARQTTRQSRAVSAARRGLCERRDNLPLWEQSAEERPTSLPTKTLAPTISAPARRHARTSALLARDKKISLPLKIALMAWIVLESISYAKGDRGRAKDIKILLAFLSFSANLRSWQGNQSIPRA